MRSVMAHYCGMAVNERSNLVSRTRHERDMMVHSAARKINEDLTDLTAVLLVLERNLIHSFRLLTDSDARRPMAGHLLVARELRRAVFVAIGHRFAMTLLPLAIDLMAGRRRMDAVITDEMAGARGRVLHGGSATIAATIRRTLGPVRIRMFAEWTRDERAAVLGSVFRLSREVSWWARAAHKEEFGTTWSPDQHVDPYRSEGGASRPYRSRTLSFLGYHLNPNLEISLRNSELGQAEHLAVGLADLHHAFITAGCPVPARLPTALEHLEAISSLAALRDEVAEKIVFEFDHTPLYRVVPVGDRSRWSVNSLRAPMTKRLQDRPGRCPAVNELPPVTARDRELVAAFWRYMDALTDGRSPTTGPRTTVSAADVSAVLGVLIADQLVGHHGVTVVPGGVTR
jgi:hypothetical protein